MAVVQMFTENVKARQGLLLQYPTFSYELQSYV